MSKQNSIQAMAEKANGLVIDSSNSAMFAIFAKKKWLQLFDASPFKFVLLPLVGLGFVLNAVFAALGFSKMANKNITRTAGLIAIILGAMCASVSIFGGMLSELIWQAPFLIGPYFFLSAVSIGLAFNLSQVIVSSIALAKAPKASIEHIQYKRNLINHLFLSGLLASIVLSVIFVMLAPTVAPVVGTMAAISSSIFCGLSFLYTCLPNGIKKSMDKALGLTVPAVDMALTDDKSEQAKNEIVMARKQQVQIEKECHQSLFSRAYRKKVVHSYLLDNKPSEAERYLKIELNTKLQKLDEKLVKMPNDVKHLDKKNLLLALQDSLDNGRVTTEEELNALYARFKNARQSFFTYEVGDVEDLVQAIMLFRCEKAKAVAYMPETSIQSIVY